jgi:hypothetical protein
MSGRTISFEIDEELEGHLLALAGAWDKDPIQLAKALFTEELMGQTSGSCGTPHLRRYLYRDDDVCFTPKEKEARERKMEAYWASEEGQAVREQQRLDFERLKAATERHGKAGQSS